MVSLDAVLNRINYGWDVILGETLYNSIRDSVRPSDDFVALCTQFAIEMHGPELLRNKKKRNVILQHLRDEEASKLVEFLKEPIDSTPQKTLINTSFTKNSFKERILFTFFGQSPPIEEEKEVIPDVEEISGVQYPLYDYQRDVLSRAMDCYHGNNNSLMIQMPTGSGKTRVAMNMIVRVLTEGPAVVLWLAYSEELCEQAVSEFKRAWSHLGDRSVSVSRFYEKHSFTHIEDGLIIAGLSKLWLYQKNHVSFLNDISKKVTLLVFDEAHQAVADTYMQMVRKIRMYNEKCAFVGLSATPGRTSDEETDRLIELFNANIIKIRIKGYNSPIAYLYEKGYLSRPTFTQLTTKAGVRVDDLLDDYGVNILKAIGSNSKRNDVILDAALNAILVKGHKKVLIFAASVESAEYLTFKLKMNEQKAFVVTSNTDSYQRKKSLESFKNESEVPVVMCNFGVLTTGVDIPSIDCVIIARPTTSMILYSQMVGRGLRGPAMGGTETSEIITVADTDLSGYGSVIQAYSHWDENWS